jgi:hypothetical protein
MSSSSRLRSGRSAPPPRHEIDIGSRLEERIGRGIDAIHAWDRIEDNVLLLAGVVRSDLVQSDFAERELRTLLGPADRGIVGDVAASGEGVNTPLSRMPFACAGLNPG